jgi:glucose-6-phosphate 1-dehydrogenase
MIDRLVLLGATGDLAGRYVLPALAALHAAGELPSAFSLSGAGRAQMDDAAFRRTVVDELARHAPEAPPASRDAFVAATRYRQVDITDPGSLGALLADAEADRPGVPLAIYLALPPSLFAPTVRTLCTVGLPVGSRVVVEKPFGEDLASAVQLNGLLGELCDRIGGAGAFRVDHFLALESVQNLLGLRLGNRILEPVWNSEHVEQIDVVWEETLGLEGRAAYYDGVGQLRDMIQNHLLQVLCLLTLEPPATLGDPDLGGAKVALLRSVRPPAAADMARSTRRGRYTAGRIGDRVLPSYVDEPGVDPRRGTETFAEVAFEVDNERWAGTRLVVRTGKGLGRPRMQVVARFRPVPGHAPDGEAAVRTSNELHIGLDDDGAVTMHLNGASAGAPPRPAPLVLTGRPPASALPPYGRVLLDVLTGDSALSVGAEESEQTWRIVEPVLDAWATDDVPLLDYPAGSEGPH